MRFGRRRLVQGGLVAGAVVAAPTSLAQVLISARPAVADSPPGNGTFLDPTEMKALRALCDRFIPGPPEDPDPGAVAAQVPEFIDLLLGAFDAPGTPRVFAGGPWSDRRGGERNWFVDFLDLDELEELVWRTRIEGSRGIPEREWNGPVRGWQEIYRSGLRSLDAAARNAWWGCPDYASLPLFLRQWFAVFPPPGCEEVVGLAFTHTLDGMYGIPEYGGNKGLVGWRYIGFAGDTQPLGWTPQQVSEPDPSGDRITSRATSGAASFVPKGAVRG